MEIVTDFTVSWTASDEITISWDGGESSKTWILLLDGEQKAEITGSGSLSKSLKLFSFRNHSLMLLSHDGTEILNYELIPAPLIQSVVTWVAVEKAYEYLIVETDEDGNEFNLYVERERKDALEVYSYTCPSSGWDSVLDVRSFQVYARSSFGLSAIPSFVLANTVGLPPLPRKIESAEGSDGSLSITISVN